MNLLTYMATLRARLAESDLSRDRIVTLSDGAISKSWLDKFVVGKMANPRVLTLVALESAMAKGRGEPPADVDRAA